MLSHRRSADLEHEVLDDTMEVDAVVETLLHQRQEVSCMRQRVLSGTGSFLHETEGPVHRSAPVGTANPTTFAKSCAEQFLLFCFLMGASQKRVSIQSGGNLR
jgi:hypothetical protein